MRASERLYMAASIAVAGAAVLAAAVYAARSSPPLDAQGFPIGHDFVNLWMGARAALGGHPAAIFAFAPYQAQLRAIFGPLPPHDWSYPPQLFLFLWPLGALPYLWAYAAWSVAGLSVYLYAATRGGCDWRALLFLIAAPASLMNLFDGQNGFFISAAMIGGLLLMDRRPLFAGMLFALLTLKPQLAIVLPVMLLASGRWRVLAAAAATTLALFLATCIVFGFAIWAQYIREVLPLQRAIMDVEGGVAPAMMPTVFIGMRMIGAPLVLSYAVQICATAAALAAVGWTYARKRDAVLSQAFLATAVFLATPYAFSYDMPVLAWAILRLRLRADQSRSDTLLNLAVWLLPIAMIPLPAGAARGARGLYGPRGLRGKAGLAACRAIGRGARAMWPPSPQSQYIDRDKRFAALRHLAEAPGAISSTGRKKLAYFLNFSV
jgi:alpha-1,2-mannosyltransferase